MNTFSREDIKAFVAIAIVIIVTLVIIAAGFSSVSEIPSPTEAWEQSTNLRNELAQMTKNH